ncbi:hypothetical protein HVIM_04281 [Roseomonas mucosa]|nr:hypothetical protein HVIM_04281 [Roseomonas mucosa]QDE00718.1 hypothetical protein ADP8_04281 [Roseomonas mucosa]UZO93009.1 hypothetical protein RMP42_04281 [Roseomonas mucosa]
MLCNLGFAIAKRDWNGQIQEQEEGWSSSCRVTGVSSLNFGPCLLARPFLFVAFRAVSPQRDPL